MLSCFTQDVAVNATKQRRDGLEKDRLAVKMDAEGESVYLSRSGEVEWRTSDIQQLTVTLIA